MVRAEGTIARMRRRPRLVVAALLATIAATVTAFTLAAGSPPRHAVPAANTKIEHLVVIFDENVSFDHYFGTYPNATNPPGQPAFTAAPGTPPVDGLTGPLRTANPNSANPARLDRSQAVTCDQNHNYANEQQAFNGGAMNKFVQFTAGGGCTDPSIVMDYYDGNTVTALWNVAQHFAMSDNAFASTFGPSTPGALNLIAGTTHGAAAGPGVENGTVIGDPDPMGDDCGSGSARLSGQNIGDLMNTAGMTWGWFQGGFKPTARSGATAVCGASHKNVAGGGSGDYSAHHAPFQYFASTANPHHLPPTSTAMIGQGDQANHQYDLTDFDAAVHAGNLPQVSFLKAASFEDGHPGNSGPLDEQRWIARVLNEVQQSSDWASTAVVIAYDDSDGWYDHAFRATTSPSAAASDKLNGDGVCGIPGPVVGAYLDRCGPGPRLPLLVASPWAKPNYVDSTPTDQASIIRFVEDNWNLPRLGDQSFDAAAGVLDNLFDFAQAPQPKLYLDPTTGTVLGSPPAGSVSAPPGPDPGTPPPGPGSPTPTGTTTTTTTTTTPVTPPTVTKPVVKPKLTATGRRRGRKVTLALRLSGLKAGKATATLKLTFGRRTIATAKRTLRTSRVALTLTAKKPVRKGTYKLSVNVVQAGRLTRLAVVLKLK
jgi:phospholipase C